ncbi:hypothetical protein HNV28_05165 [Myxococcus xanthus]|uniref:Uncharacterized protein n=1 Tax=Myxococcus xanthus TaxID=34 RepID=A0A7Y4IF74_MYXXA|nr:hypothetical protein [Myxococcus xanthus]
MYAKLVDELMTKRPHPQQRYRSSLGVQRLTDGEGRMLVAQMLGNLNAMKLHGMATACAAGWIGGPTRR